MPEPRVHILSDNTANQIAAGEVVERPASVVKELVENAVDAGARVVTVELEDGGKRLIRITDDGVGMIQEDAILSLQRHATSKINSSDDLFSILTMGFRGEALPSIASVSRTTIVTHARDAEPGAAGTKIFVDGGEIAGIDEVGARPGTTIEVADLFFNVPARMKFLRSTSAELSHVSELVRRFALAHPSVSFKLLHYGSEIFASYGSGSLMDACVQVFGREPARKLIPLNCVRGETTVTGYVGAPDALKPTRAAQHFFVNSRVVRDRTIVKALDEAYASVQTIHGHRFPMCAIMVNVPPALVDVNVAPTKTEVRFTQERDVFSAVYHAVQDALVGQGGLVPSITDRLVPSSVGDVPSQVSSAELDVLPHLPSTPSRPTAKSPLTSLLGEEPKWEFRRSASANDEEQPYAPTASVVEPNPVAPEQAPAADLPTVCESAGPRSSAPLRQNPLDLSGLTVLAQTRNMYILAQTNHALLVIDQHIAHERILYERLLAGNAANALAVQHLVIPVTVELTHREAQVVEARLAELAKAGFHLEPFGVDTFLLRAAPASVAKYGDRIVKEVIDELVEKTVSRKLLVPAEEVLITASCKMAIKAGDPLEFTQMRALVDELLACENPYTCPHGRPVIIELPNNDLDRKFGRI